MIEERGLFYPGVKPVETPNLGVSTISGGQYHVNDQMLDEDVTADTLEIYDKLKRLFTNE